MTSQIFDIIFGFFKIYDFIENFACFEFEIGIFSKQRQIKSIDTFDMVIDDKKSNSDIRIY